jgi:hypothetical protein
MIVRLRYGKGGRASRRGSSVSGRKTRADTVGEPYGGQERVSTRRRATRDKGRGTRDAGRATRVWPSCAPHVATSVRSQARAIV